MKKKLLMVFLFSTICSCRPRATTGTDLQGADSNAFIKSLLAVPCVKLADENRNSSLPGGGKGTGVFTVVVQENVDAKACSSDIQGAIPDVQIGEVNQQLHIIYGIKPPQAPVEGPSFVQALRAVPCVRIADENVNSSLPGGGKKTGFYTVAVQDDVDANKCAEDIRQAILGVQIGNVNPELKTIFNIRPRVISTEGVSFAKKLESVPCVKFAAENVNSSLPGGGKPTGIFTVSVREKVDVNKCVGDIRRAIPDVQIGNANQELSSIFGVKPPSSKP